MKHVIFTTKGMSEYLLPKKITEGELMETKYESYFRWGPLVIYELKLCDCCGNEIDNIAGKIKRTYIAGQVKDHLLCMRCLCNKYWYTADGTEFRGPYAWDLYTRAHEEDDKEAIRIDSEISSLRHSEP